ncbi:MAG: hypothetical protein ACPHXR_02095 [Flavicella sp.]
MSSVDVYPAFQICDSLIDSKAVNACFENQFHYFISKDLSTQLFSTTEDIEDTIKVKIIIDAYGKTELIGINTPSLIKKTLPIIDSVINKSFQNIPRLRPALKRGVPVSVLFNVPIVVKTNELIN